MEEVIGEPALNGLADTNSTHAPIVADCCDVKPGGAELLGASNKPAGPTIRCLQSLVDGL